MNCYSARWTASVSSFPSVMAISSLKKKRKEKKTSVGLWIYVLRNLDVVCRWRAHCKGWFAGVFKEPYRWHVLITLADPSGWWLRGGEHEGYRWPVHVILFVKTTARALHSKTYTAGHHWDRRSWTRDISSCCRNSDLLWITLTPAFIVTLAAMSQRCNPLLWRFLWSRTRTRDYFLDTL